MNLLSLLLCALTLLGGVFGGARPISRNDLELRERDDRGWAERARTLAWQNPARRGNFPVAAVVFHGALIAATAFVGWRWLPATLGPWPILAFLLYALFIVCGAFHTGTNYHILTLAVDVLWSLSCLAFSIHRMFMGRPNAIATTNLILGPVWFFLYFLFLICFRIPAF